ncbi:hypothetical protein VaNZ11_013840 [Volvox africanus]|uniref:ERCC1-like central domain-containing protein n=1 Tax=Volvox africanus TaxID=51714 RepID=A0ABQ5SH47_9CHLO|nr:hypothetical protein VaNZ11_013840 [Volvox africanus]
MNSESVGHPQQTGQQPPAQGQPPRHIIQLPTWQEVQAAKQPSAQTILFRSTGLLAAARQQQQHVPQATSAAGAGGTMGAPARVPGSGVGSSFPSHSSAPWPNQMLSVDGYGTTPSYAARALGSEAGSVRRPGLGTNVVFTTGTPGGGGGGSGCSGGIGGLSPGPSLDPAQYGPPRPVASSGMLQQPPAGPIPPPNVVLVNRRQQGNPVLKHIRNVRWQFADIVPDYQLGQGTAALFLSLRYHLLHPDYILHRIREQQRMFRLTVLLVHVDVDDVIKPLGEVTRAAVVGDCTLVCAWSPEECARWLETYKSYESKPAFTIQERVEPDYVSRLAAVLAGSVRGINRTDAHTLGTRFRSLAAMMRCSDSDRFSACPGIGPTKVRRVMEAFHEPFRKQLKMTGSAAAAGTAGAATVSTTAPMAVNPTAVHALAGAVVQGAAAPVTVTLSAAGPATEYGQAGPASAPAAVASAEEEGREGTRDGQENDFEDANRNGGATRTEEGVAPAELDGGGDRVPDEGRTRQLQHPPGWAPGPGSSGGAEAQRQQLLELFMSQMPAGDDDVSDGDEDYEL